MHSLLDHWLFEVRKHKIRDQKGLWVNSFFRQLAYALISILSSVFVFEFGRDGMFGGGVVGGLVMLLLFFLVIRLTVVCLIIWIGNYVVRRIGYRRSVLVSVVLAAGAFLSLSLASTTGEVWWILAAAILFGLNVTTYWVTYFTLFSDDAPKARIGSSFGLLEAVSKAGQVAAPFIGAVVASRLGFSWLFIVGIGFLVVSGIPMFFLGSHLHLDEVSWGEFFSWVRERTFLTAGMAMGGRFVNQTMYENIWPVYVFLLVGSLEKVGVFGSLILLATTVFTFMVSRLFDRSGKKRFQIIGVAGGVVMWVMRLFVRELGQVVVVDSVDKFFNTMSRMFFFGYVFRRAQGKESFSFVVYWLWWQSFWAVLAYVALLVLLVCFGVGGFWPAVIGLGTGGLILSLLIRDHK